MIVYPSMQQDSPEWRRIRAGRATASNFDRIMTPSKMEYSAQAKGYICELIAGCFETDVDDDAPEFENYWTRRGKSLEPLARAELQKITGFNLVQVGFCLHDNGILGFSPDALAFSDGSYPTGGEVKCPMPATHVQYVCDGVLPKEYAHQVHGSMIIGNFNEYHFLSYCPGMQPFYIKVTPDGYTEKLAACLDRFVNEYREMMNSLIPKLQLTLPSS